jgi:hypothetical protein
MEQLIETSVWTTQVVAAIVTSIASLVVAVFGLVTARSARAHALAAEDAVQQKQLVRLRALEAIETLTKESDHNYCFIYD